MVVQKSLTDTLYTESKKRQACFCSLRLLLRRRRECYNTTGLVVVTTSNYEKATCTASKHFDYTGD